MTVYKKLLLSVAAILVISTIPVACDNNSKTEPVVNTDLESRVSARWNAVMEADLDKAYEFLSPINRKLFPREQFYTATGSNVLWDSMQIDNIQIDGDRAEVKVTILYRLILPMGAGDDFGLVNKNIKEVWLWNDGNWWYYNDATGSQF